MPSTVEYQVVPVAHTRLCVVRMLFAGVAIEWELDAAFVAKLQPVEMRELVLAQLKAVASRN